MTQDLDIARLLELRRLTTALAGFFNRLLQEHLNNLAPMLQPRSLLGDLVRFEKCAVKDQDAALQELGKLYEPVARVSALNLQPELTPPLDLYARSVELVPASYQHTPEGSSTPVTIVTPLKWVMVYKDANPSRLRELVSSHARSGGADLQSAALHYLVMHMIMQRRPGVAPILEALRFPVKSEPNRKFGGLPFVTIAAPISTMRAPDAVILQSTQISGTDSFEEVVDTSRLAASPDPLLSEVQELARVHGVSMAQDVQR